jgi:hypothetical protein
VLLLILIVVGFKSCVDNRRTNALKDYNREVSSIVQSSDDQVSRQLFDVLSGGGRANDLQSAVQQVRLVADEDVKRARALSVPGAMNPAQRNLELILNLRAQGVAKIAELIPTALSDQAVNQEAVRRIAGQMEAFLASDVVYSQRVAPLIRDALNGESVTGQTIAQSQFLPSIAWLDPSVVADRLGSTATTGTGGTSSKTPTPGTHGHGLISVRAGAVALQPGGVINRVPATANPTFTVTIANQGQNDEGPVTVSLRVTGAGRTITVNKRINQTRAGSNAEVAIPLGRSIPAGSSATIAVSVRAVPGEQKTDNNRAEYTALFIR